MLRRGVMRTRRTTALSDDKPEVDVTRKSKAKNAVHIGSKADIVSSGHRSDAVALGDKEEQKAPRAMKRGKKDAEKTQEIVSASLTGHKRQKSDIVEQKGEKAKGPAASQKQRRSSAVAQEGQQAPAAGTQDLNGTAYDNQAAIPKAAEMGGEPAAVRNDAAEMPEDDDDDAPEEVASAS